MAAAQTFLAPVAFPTNAPRAGAASASPSFLVQADDFARFQPVTLKAVGAMTAAGLLACAAFATAARRRSGRKAKVPCQSSVVTYVDGRARFVVGGGKDAAPKGDGGVVTYVDGKARFVVNGTAPKKTEAPPATPPAKEKDFKSDVMEIKDGKARFVASAAQQPPPTAPKKAAPPAKEASPAKKDAPPAKRKDFKTDVVNIKDGKARFVVDSSAPKPKAAAPKAKTPAAAPARSGDDLRSLLLK